MLKIKIHNVQELAITGTDLIKAMQNKSTQLLDLLVRESIQNCLDAHDPRDGSRFVEVGFSTGSFDSRALCSHLEGINTIDKNQTANGDYQYIAIRDTHTTGLTGPLSVDDVVNNQYGNLQKLVYQIFKNQTASGAGGAWGIGKTTYFRIGIGLVVYYSRIRLSNGQFQSRLSATLVEDSQSPWHILRESSQNPSGIAWWGTLTARGSAAPITDEAEISDIVNNVFHAKLYQGSETGTTIIIPYIKEKYLLHHNEVCYPTIESLSKADDGDDVSKDDYISLPWTEDLDSYIRMAIQRWYAPRLNNPEYFTQWRAKYLKVSVNEQYIKDLDPVFRIFRDLYNVANGKNRLDSLSSCQITAEKIPVRKQLETTEGGTLSYTIVSRSDLGLQPWDKVTPAVTCNCDLETFKTNAPIIAFTRKPGMVVSYSDSDWNRDLPHADKDHFVFAFFVLNSDNLLRGTRYTLEDYIREGEKSDHMMWEDCQFKDITPKSSIVDKIQNGVSKKLASFIKPAEKDVDENDSYNPASSILGDMLMPIPTEEGSPTPPDTQSGGGGGGTGKTKKCSYSYKTRYQNGEMFLEISIKSVKGRTLKLLDCELVTESSGSPIKANTWEGETNLPIPVEISGIDMETTGKDISNQPLITDSMGACYGHRFSFPDCAADIRITYKLKLNRKDVRPHILISND